MPPPPGVQTRAGSPRHPRPGAVNCICQNGPQRPGMQEVLNSLERHTVCTGTQCFEGEEDAFGITTTPNGAPTNNPTFFMFMLCVALPAPALAPAPWELPPCTRLRSPGGAPGPVLAAQLG